MLTICFFNDQPYTEAEEEGDAVFFDYTSDGFKALIDTGVFNIPTTNVTGRWDSIDLSIYRDTVRNVFRNYPMWHPEQNQILSAVEKYRYFTMIG